MPRKLVKQPKKVIVTNDFVDIFVEIINTLSSVGYHRARVTHVTPYDKIVGGISWMLSVFHPFVCGEEWVFREWDPKPNNVKQLEVNQIVRAMKMMENAIPVTHDDFIMANMAAQRDIVLWLANKVKESDKKEQRYKHFLECFNKMFTDEEAATNELMYNFRLQERPTRNNQIDLFDISIIRDNLVTGWMVLAEFINYESTGKRIFRKFDLREDLAAQQVCEWREINRAKLKEIAERTVLNLQCGDDKVFANKMASWIENLKLADLMTQTESRVLLECRKYYADQKEYSTLKEKSRSIQQTLYQRVDVAKVQLFINDAITRINTLHQAISVDLNVMAGETYSEASENKSKDLQKKLHVLTELVSTIQEAFRAFCNAREQRDKDEPNSKKNGDEIDEKLAEDCLMVNRELDGTLILVKCLRPENKKPTSTIVNVFYSFVTDVRSQWTNWHWKAKMLSEQRREMQLKLQKLQLAESRIQRETRYGKLEEEEIKQLDALLSSAKKDFDLWEKESPEFQRLHPSDGSNKDVKPEITLISSSGRKIATRANKFTRP
uniref:Coiled-coil domain-containing protein 93 n=1 Tax=Caenorhabditis tropicalis TaxID=1561998 RepID=A0A1I7TRC0_9PELO